MDVELNRANHVLGIKDGVEIFLSKYSFLKHKLNNAAACLHGLLGNLCRMLVTDVGVEGCNDADAAVNLAAAVIFVGSNASTQSVRSVSHALAIRSTDSKQH